MDDHASATKIPSRNVRGRASALLACAMFGGGLLAAGCSAGSPSPRSRCGSTEAAAGRGSNPRRKRASRCPAGRI